MKALFVEYPRCTTCKKALKYLREHQVEVETRHIVEEVPSTDELRTWIEKSGLEPKKFFNTSGQVYKEMGLKDQVGKMSLDEIVILLSTNGMLIKRPLLITDEKVFVGFKEEQYKTVTND